MAGVTAGWFALTLGASGMTPAETQAQLVQWLGDQPGGVAAARLDATGVAFAQAGKFSASDTRPVTADTEFEIGSVTKVFTALLLADAVNAGKVKLDDKVGAPFGASEITYRQLATHTSGLPRLPGGFIPADPANPYAEYDVPALAGAFAKEAGAAQPGAKAEYSNFGFAVLGQAVAGAWGQPYAALLRERVIGPLGLRDTVTSWREAERTRLAPGHSDQGPVANWDLGAYAPAGALVSTSRDLAVFVQDCLRLRETPLAAAIAETLRPRGPGLAPGWESGLAWVVGRRGDSTIVWHNGGTGGYRSFVGFDVEKRVGVVVLTNHSRSVDALGMSLLGVAPPPAKAGMGGPVMGGDYAGNYPLAPSFVMAVTVDADGMWLQATNQPRLKLRPAAADRFAVEGVAAEVSFERDGAGNVVALVLHQNGRDQRAPRLAPGVMPAAPKEVALSAEELEAYVGEYSLGLAVFTVKRDGERLMVQLTGQPFLRVFASAKDEFFYKVVEARLSFVRGADGKVAALVLHQNGRDQRAEKKGR